MLDLKLIREQPDAVQRGLVTRGGAELVPEILAADAARRRLVTEVETLKAERNRTSEAVGQAKRRVAREAAACRPMTKKAVAAKLKENAGLPASALTLASQT